MVMYKRDLRLLCGALLNRANEIYPGTRFIKELEVDCAFRPKCNGSTLDHVSLTNNFIYKQGC